MPRCPRLLGLVLSVSRCCAHPPPSFRAPGLRQARSPQRAQACPLPALVGRDPQLLSPRGRQQTKGRLGLGLSRGRGRRQRGNRRRGPSGAGAHRRLGEPTTREGAPSRPRRGGRPSRARQPRQPQRRSALRGARPSRCELCSGHCCPARSLYFVPSVVQCAHLHCVHLLHIVARAVS